jgi:hypothetical protein
MRKTLFLIFLIIFSFQKANSQKTKYFSASINACGFSDTPQHFLNPTIEYNYSRFSFYVGPILSNKNRIRETLNSNSKGTYTIPGLIGGCKFTLFDSIFNNRIFFNVSINGGYLKYKYYDIFFFSNNTHTAWFLELIPGITIKILKKLFVTFQFGSGIEYKVREYKDGSYEYTDYVYQPLILPQFGISYKFLK